MLCQHLRFHETDAHLVTDGRFRSGTEIASGDLMCYKEQPSGTSCCVHLESSTTTKDVRISFARCEYTACIANNYTYRGWPKKRSPPPPPPHQKWFTWIIMATNNKNVNKSDVVRCIYM